VTRTNRCTINVHARTNVVQWTANSLNGVSGEGVPRHVEEAHRCVPGDVKAGSVVEKDALDLLPTDVPATLNAALRTATSPSGVHGTSVPRPVVKAISPVTGRAWTQFVVEKTATLTSHCMKNVHARTNAVQWTANLPNGESSDGVPRHVEEVRGCARGDVRVGNVEEKDVLDLLPTDVTVTHNAALRTAFPVSGVRGASVPRAVAEALSPVTGRARAKRVEERIVIQTILSMRNVHAEKSAVPWTEVGAVGVNSANVMSHVAGDVNTVNVPAPILSRNAVAKGAEATLQTLLTATSLHARSTNASIATRQLPVPSVCRPPAAIWEQKFTIFTLLC